MTLHNWFSGMVCADPSWLPISKISSAVWMPELSKVGCKDLRRFCEFFGAGGGEQEQDTSVLVH